MLPENWWHAKSFRDVLVEGERFALLRKYSRKPNSRVPFLPNFSFGAVHLMPLAYLLWRWLAPAEQCVFRGWVPVGYG